jgi:hypothetical protein
MSLGITFLNTVLLSQYQATAIPKRRRRKILPIFISEFGLALPSYIIESSVFYLAHTDLSISNLLVDPSDGTLLRIIDLEFANTLPPQAVEHYPSFLGNRAEFVEHYEGLFDDPTTELEGWRAQYNKQFIDQPAISVFNDRIDAISNFEHLLRYPNERTLTKIADALEVLQSVNAHSPNLYTIYPGSHIFARNLSRFRRMLVQSVVACCRGWVCCWDRQMHTVKVTPHQSTES